MVIGESISSAGFKSIYRSCDTFSELSVFIRGVIFADENSLHRGLQSTNSLGFFADE